ncbi:protein O-linked-mannose beta-1,4-N-acetylglucosaminyltransferase 2-like [Ornithodoros turicata]|uniref:protein O-linked-mannose beta-1,4-N-acetylglucosaminyltransferase 2-like n=1 Tax=Ornithodoros turicata TaxID=34597 RepID=UPI003138A467
MHNAPIGTNFGMGGLTISYREIVLVCIWWTLNTICEFWNVKQNNLAAQPAMSVEDAATSVWCRGSNYTERMCIFRNLYYRGDTGDFIFFHGQKSSALGLVEGRLEVAELSSISDHSALYFTYTDMPINELSRFHISTVQFTTLIMSRLNPDNIMHAIHDDLVPIFSTARELCACETCAEIHSYLSSLTVFFADSRQKGRYWELYRMLLPKSPILGVSLKSSQLVRLEKAIVGLRKESTWYQYGFKSPQGPIQEHFSQARLEVAQFVEYFRNAAGVKLAAKSRGCAVFLKRTQNRRVLNEDALLAMVRRYTGLETIVLDINSEPMSYVIKLISRADMLTAMHGSALVLSMFLKPNSAVLELFPYGINPEHYTPYKTLAHLRGIFYLSWRNTNKSNTVAHPNRKPHLGGIMHLSPEEQQKVLDSDKVPQHLCCEDPEWLFRIYQDTVVDNSIVPLLEKIRRARQDYTHPPRVDKLLPGFVRDVECLVEEVGHLLVRWKEPWNTNYVTDSDCQYEVWLQTESGVTAVKTRCCYYSVNINETVLKIWVRAICAGNIGGFNVFPAQCSVE